MIAALALAAAMMGQGAGAPQTPAPTKAVGGDCSSTKPDPASNAIVVCVEKPQGYRIDPDVLAARKAKRQALAGRPKPPETLKDRNCAVVGPAGCQFDAPGVNLLAAAGTAAEMADRLSKGQEVGSMFVTDPQTSEYQYYQLARKQREAKEAAARIKARAAANAAKASR